VDIAAALHRQVRNDPGKNNLAVLFFVCAFPGDENMTSSPPSPQPRLVSARQEKRPVRLPRLGASVTYILVSTESDSSDNFN
jgi:hypothetical protein